MDGTERKTAGKISRRRRPRREEGSGASRLALGALKGCAVGTGAGAIAVLALSAAAYACADPAELTYAMGLGAFVLASLAAGGSAVRFTGDGVLSGALAGAMLSAVIFAVSLALPGWGTTVDTSVRVILHLGAIPLGALGAAVMKKRKKKRRRR